MNDETEMKLKPDIMEAMFLRVTIKLLSLNEMAKQVIINFI